MRNVIEIELDVDERRLSNDDVYGIARDLCLYAEEKNAVNGADVLCTRDSDWIAGDDKHMSLLDHAVGVMYQNNVDWYMKYHKTMQIWRNVLLCFVNSENVTLFDALFEEWMKDSGFLEEARKQMSPKALKSLLGIEK